MAPSPAMRFSPEREPKRHDDDDLALFNEVESRESDNFLLHPSHDFEDSFSTKLRYFSDIKHGIAIPGRGVTSELLDGDGDKNDYDWLLTPPDTPLFPSLDDEPPPQINVVSRGRPRSKPVSLSRSSSMEKSFRSSMRSTSPNHLSPSPSSGNNTLQPRGRPSSAPNSNPIQSLLPAAASRKQSPPPNKPTTPAPRSATPTPRRISIGSIVPAVSSGIRGASPVKTSRGNSTTKFSRQSMSPTASRSSSTFRSHDGGQFFSSHNKGSVASSGDDDQDSPQSIRVGSLDRRNSRKGGSLSNIKSSSFSKKSGRMVSQNSAPKRSFDSAIRQMDKRSPQNMFRPLLSSVPTTTFYVGKTNSAPHSLVSMNSSVTNSSNAGSDHGRSLAPDTEESDHNQDDGASETEMILYSDIHEEVFSSDKIDILDANIGHDINSDSVDVLHNETRGPKIAVGSTESEDSVYHGIDTELNDSSETSHVRGGTCELDCFENAATCSNCGYRYEVTGQAEKNVRLCLECRRENTVFRHINLETALAVPRDSSVISENFPAEENPLTETDQLQIMSKLAQETIAGDMRVPLDEHAEKNKTSSSELIQIHSQQSPLPSSLVAGSDIHTNQIEVDQSGADYKKPDDHSGDQQLYHSKDRPDLKAGLLEGTGISVSLKRSSSNKGSVVQGRTFTATTLSYDDLSFARDSINSFRSSTGHGSYSTSSSVDFSPARQSEFSVQRQASCRKLDVDCGCDTRIKRPSTGSSISGTSNHSRRGLGLATQETTTVNTECGIVVDTPEVQQEMKALDDGLTDVIEASVASIVVEEDKLESLDCSRVKDASWSELLSDVSVQPDDNSVALVPDHVEDHPNDASSVSNTETSVKDPESSFDEKHDANNTNVGVMDAMATTNTSTITESEIEGKTYRQNDIGVVDQDDDPLLASKSAADDFQGLSVPNASNDCPTASVSELNTSECSHGTEGSTITVESQGAGNTKRLTLEEATNTILLCSSIIHDLAYQAATIAMEKQHSEAMEKEQHSDPFEGSKPTLTILGNANSDREESRSKTASKRASNKPQKVKPRPMVETDKTKNNENVDESLPRIVGLPDKVDDDGIKPPNKLESKCNCIIM